MLLHRKNDRREATSRSLSRYAASLLRLTLRSARIAMDAQQEVRIDQHALERELDAGVEAAAVAPAAVEELEQRLHVAACVTGRRYASRAIRDRIFVAQARSSAASVGWQTKIARRLGVSGRRRPAAVYGPPIWTEPTFA